MRLFRAFVAPCACLQAELIRQDITSQRDRCHVVAGSQLTQPVEVLGGVDTLRLKTAHDFSLVHVLGHHLLELLPYHPTRE